MKEQKQNHEERAKQSLLYIVSIDGRARSESGLGNVTQKAVVGDWRGEL